MRRITNESGHYKPSIEQANQFTEVFKQSGLNVKNTWLEIHNFKSSSSNYIVDDEIIINRPILGNK